MWRRSVFKFRHFSRLAFPVSPPAPRYFFGGSLAPRVARAFAETVFWCSQQTLESSSNDPEFLRNRRLLEQRSFIAVSFKHLAPLSNQLRSVSLQPSADVGEIFDDGNREQLIAGVIEQRSQLLTPYTFDEAQVLSSPRGRVLIYEPAQNVADGASQVGSLGFFDINDAPPWDTWIHYESGKLACWVPQNLLTLAQNGIDANPVQCIYWAGQ